MSTTAPLQPRRATRDTTDQYLGGVAAGLARHLGLPVLWVRLFFLLSTVLGGLGVGLYAGLWVMLPSEARFTDEPPGLASATRTGRRPGRVRRMADVGPLIALFALGAGLILAAETVFGRGALFWPIALGLVGVALIWRQLDEAQRDRWLDTTGRIDPLGSLLGHGSGAAYLRLFAGGALILSGLVFYALRSGDLGPAREVLVAGVLGVLGLAIALGPWVWRMATDLTDERAERVRSQERADVAAHLHDSVLQTLALIQKNADDPATVSRLARAQERDLRSWLFTGESAGGESLGAALRAIAAQAEQDHVVAVDVVTVGDTPLTELVEPVVHAAREAVTNSAKHAGTGKVDVYAETTATLVEIFVKDRGVGFDPAAVGADRHGLRGSVVGRMARHGGTAEIRSTPGAGTEIVLRMPLDQEETP
ncbi:ATP-binding protein [Nocardioides donggukensis]|uniref:PspC domain-containing protein n=1 Tax=Nocardioides donggukensis TaxID=2774019 RepID=A0A927K4A4_9ACTN|nr:ATP-binding protein [Nocardioides donggukensis]MBD8868598.1 PspC domain-containing protein [Nocardioides donggukensis]